MTTGRSRFSTDLVTKEGKETTSDSAGHIYDLKGNNIPVTETVTKPPDPPKFAGGDTDNTDYTGGSFDGDTNSGDVCDGGGEDGIVNTVVEFFGSFFS